MSCKTPENKVEEENVTLDDTILVTPSGNNIIYGERDKVDQIDLLIEEKNASGNFKDVRKGHRNRLRSKVLASGSSSLADYELLEILLFSVYARQDTKPLARHLIDEYGNLGAVMSASNDKLLKTEGVTEAVVATIRVAESLGEALLKSKIENRNVIGSWQSLLEYCQGTMGRKEIEHFRILFLDNKNKLIADELQQTGTINQTAVYPREVVKRTLELNATAIILVHNHPSGDTMPSKSDIRITEDIINATQPIGISVHDHLIVSNYESTSMKSMGLI